MTDRIVLIDLWYRLHLAGRRRGAEAFAEVYRAWVLDEQWAELVEKGNDVF